MAFYASGSISAYKKLRKIVDCCFSDPTRRPFVSLMKTRGEVKIIIFNDKTKSETIIPINDVEKLNRMYERLYRMAFVRRRRNELFDADRFLDWLKEFHPNDVVIMSGVRNARTVIEAEVSE